MNDIFVKIKKLTPNVKLPNYAHHDDAGMDLFSQEDFTLQPGERRICSLGFALEFPEGYVALMWDKSGLAGRNGIHIMAGVYDSGFRGEYNTIMINMGNEPHIVERGDKIAQLLIQPIIHAELIEADELSVTQRGAGMLGSTGKK